MRIDPTGWAIGFTGCFIDWLITRQWRRIFLGFIPLFVAVSVGALVAWGSRLDRDQLAERYLELANREVEAWENQWAPADAAGDKLVNSAENSADEQAPENSPESDDAPTTRAASDSGSATQIPRFAETLFRRVQQLHSNNQRSVFFIAMTLAQRGSVPLAVARLESIAPVDREGYLPAHAMLADILLRRGTLTAENLPVVKHHARASLRWNRTSPELLVRIAELFRQTGEPDLAVRSIMVAAEREPKYNLPLAKLTEKNPKFKLQYEEALPKAEVYFRQLLSGSPQDVEARLLLADVLLMKKNFPEAEALIVEGLSTNDDPRLRYALSETYRTQFVSTSKLSGATWTGEIELLDRAFRIDPTNNKVFEEVAKLARISGTAPSEDLMAQLRKLLAEGKATSITHMWIAEYYLLKDKMAQAIPHLETAVKRDPRAAQCWNNLAYSLATLYPERLDEALKCADQAIELMGHIAEFHDTRGYVLVAMDRHTDAIVEFERAVELASRAPRDNPANPVYHDHLAASYEALGDKPMAEEHRRVAAEQRQALAQRQQASQAASEPSTPTVAPSESQTAQTTTPEPASTEPASTEPAPTEPAPTEPTSPEPDSSEPATAASEPTAPAADQQEDTESGSREPAVGAEQPEAGSSTQS